MILTGQNGLRPVKLGQHGPHAMRDVIRQSSGQAVSLAAIGATSTRSEKRSTPK